MEKNKMQPGLKTSKGKMKDYWLDGDKRNYDNDLLEGFLFAKFGFPGLSGEPLNTQQQAERGYATLEPKSKVHLRKPDQIEFFMSDALKGVRKSKVSGFCGSRLVKEKISVSVDSKNGKLIIFDEANQQPKLTGIDASDLNFFDLQPDIEKYQQALKQGSSKKPQEIDDPSIPGDYKYYAKLNAEDQSTKKPLPKVLYIYARDLNEIIKYSNTLLFGSYRKEDREKLDPKHKELIQQAITRHKIFLAEQFYQKMYARSYEHLPKKVVEEVFEPEPIQANFEQQNKENSLRNVPEPPPKKPRYDRPDKLEEAGRILKDARRRMLLRPKFNNLREYNRAMRQKNRFDNGMRLSIEKVYIIFRGNQMEKTIPEYHAGYTKKPVNFDTFRPSDLETDRVISLAPIPIDSREQHGIFNVSADTKELPPVQESGFLVVYAKDRINDRVNAVGIKNVDIGLKRVTQMDIVTKYGEKNVHSMLTFIRHDFESAGETDVPELRQILSPNMYGYMKRYETITKDDHGLSKLMAGRGVGVKYLTMRGQMMSDYKIRNSVAEIERNTYQHDEWEDFERYIEKMYDKNPQVGEIIRNDDELNDVLSSVGESNNELTSTSDEERSYLYFSRQYWGLLPEIPKFMPFYESSMVVGPPDHLCMPVWCSLGKVQLIKLMARRLVETKSKIQNNQTTGNRQSQNCYEYLRKEGEKLLEENESLRVGIERISGEREIASMTKTMIKNVIAAYMQYSRLMSETQDKQGFLMRKFSLKNISGLASIMLELVELQKKSEKGLGQRKRTRFAEEDCLWLMLAIAFVFLPEHFLVPTEDSGDYREDEGTNRIMSALGVNVRQYQKNKIFETVRAAGNNKLSLVFCYIIQQAHPKVHSKMVNYGFPFISFCIEAIDNLFTNLLNRNKLYKVWNLIFFEGSSLKKRRAQQIMLSVLLALIQSTEKSLLMAQTSDEMIWHIKAYGMLDFNTQDFLRLVLNLRMKHFVEQDDDKQGFLDKIAKGFTSLFSSTSKLERDIDKIYKEYTQRFEPISETNQAYLQTMKGFEEFRGSNNMPKITANDFEFFFMNIKEETDQKTGSQALVFDDGTNAPRITLAIKKRPSRLHFGIVHAYFGDQISQGSEVEIALSFNSFKKVLTPNSPEWNQVIVQSLDTAGFNNKSYLTITFRGYVGAKSEVYPTKIDLDILEPNRESFQHIQAGSVWILVYMKLEDPIVDTDMDFDVLDEEFIHLSRPFPRYLASVLETKIPAPYASVILNTNVDKVTCEKILSLIYGVNGTISAAKVPLMSRTIYKLANIQGQTLPMTNLFEFLLRVIVFAPTPTISKIRALFFLIWNLTHPNATSPQQIRQSHVIFLIHQLLRIALIYIPLNEVRSKVKSIRKDSSGSILNAVFTNFGASQTQVHWNCTEMMNSWLAAVKTGVLEMKHFGKVRDIWAGENKEDVGKLGQQGGKLDVLYEVDSKKRVYQVEFDKNWKVKQNKDEPGNLKEKLVVENTDDLISYSIFADIIAKYHLLDWVLSRNFSDTVLHSINTNRLSSVSNERLQLNVTISIDKVTVCKASVITGQSEDLIYMIDSLTYPTISYIANHPDKYKAGSEVVNLGNKAGMRNTNSLSNILQAVKFTAIKAIANGVDQKNHKFMHKQECLGIVFMDLQQSTINIDGEPLAEGELDLTIAEITSDKRKTTFNVEVSSDSRSKAWNYNHFAKDIFKFDGMNVDNPFTPCHVISKDDKNAKVIFEHDQTPKLIPLEDVILYVDNQSPSLRVHQEFCLPKFSREGVQKYGQGLPLQKNKFLNFVRKLNC